jgi:hypothetical protein
MPQLIISMDEGGSVSVNGPIKDRAVCYAMLELARDAILEAHLRTSLDLEQVKPSVVTASQFDLPPGQRKAR